MGFQLVSTGFLIFIIIWLILRFIVPMFFSEEKKQQLAEEEAEKVQHGSQPDLSISGMIV